MPMPMPTPANPPADLNAWLRWVLDQREAEARLLCSLAGVSGTYLRDLLAEVDALRRILGTFGEYAEAVKGGGYDTDEYTYEALGRVVRALALPHAGRPGFREEWRPA